MLSMVLGPGIERDRLLEPVLGDLTVEEQGRHHSEPPFRWSQGAGMRLEERVCPLGREVKGVTISPKCPASPRPGATCLNL